MSWFTKLLWWRNKPEDDSTCPWPLKVALDPENKMVVPITILHADWGEDDGDGSYFMLEWEFDRDEPSFPAAEIDSMSVEDLVYVKSQIDEILERNITQELESLVG